MYNVLFVCTGNICRSPMAEGLLKHMLPASLKDRVIVRSAGTHALTGNSAEPNAVQALQSLGIDIRSHRAAPLEIRMKDCPDLILVMEKMHLKRISQLFPEVAGQTFLLTQFGEFLQAPEIFDPYGQPVYSYKRCAQIIEQNIEGVVSHLERVKQP